MSGIPDAMPALLKALSMQEKARGCGFDWEQPSEVWAKVYEELSEAKEAALSCSAGDIASASSKAYEHMEEEFGDLMFAVINASRLYGVDPEKALSRSCSKFRSRFGYIEENTLKKGLKFSDLSLEQMDALWNEAKALERR